MRNKLRNFQNLNEWKIYFPFQQDVNKISIANNDSICIPRLERIISKSEIEFLGLLKTEILLRKHLIR